MKPYVICHMVSSVDGRILRSRWRPQTRDGGTLFERLHERLGGNAWLIGRVTGAEFAKSSGYRSSAARSYPREPWIARRQAAAFAVVLDLHGRIAWGRADIGGDPIVVVLGTQVDDAHLEGLRGDGVSYFFAGERTLDLRAALEFLNRELGIKRLLLEGGGHVNGAFLRAGLIDEVSLAVCPALDGAQGAPSVFDSGAAESESRAPLTGMQLASCEVLDGGAVWLRYRLENAPSD